MSQHTSSAQPVIIVVKKKQHHGGHHGGAWKVAYADFVTAMMALFIVLWLLSSSVKVQKAVGGYFKDPAGYSHKTGSGQNGLGEGLTISRNDMAKLKDKLESTLKAAPGFEAMREHVRITITGEGLRIELTESEAGTFFDSGSAIPSANGRDLLTLLTKELTKLPNGIVIEGHTDSRPYSGGGDYTNWELSADRANAARRVMQASGLRPDQIKAVRGFADQKLRLPDHPEDASNRRITVIVQFSPPQSAGPDPNATEAKAAAEHAGPAKH